ncbi:hypothetical protein ACVWYN_000598 [Pedobacter sp. UYP24]
MKIILILIVLFCLSIPSNAQTFSLDSTYTTEQKDNMSENAFNGSLEKAHLRYNPPIGFSTVKISNAEKGLFLDINYRWIANFFKVIVNKDTSIAIGLSIFPPWKFQGKMFDFVGNAKMGFISHVDSIKNTYHYLSKADLAKYNATYGVEFSAKMARSYMGKFTNHRMVYIAQQNFQIYMVFFYKNQSSIEMEKFIHDNLGVIELVK